MNLTKYLEKSPFVIAEVGSNWKNLDDCRRSIHLAKACGADAVKFQAYDHKALYGFPKLRYHDTDKLNWTTEEKMAGQLPLEWLQGLADKANSIGIEFMCSAFSPEILLEVNKYVRIHKLASSEMCHLRMLETLKALNKPTFISTGAQTLQDIKRVVDFIDDLPAVLMYCVAAYPARMIDLREIAFLENFFKMPIGYSCHSLDVLEIPNAAVEAGACVIEKHVNFVGVDSPDAPHSLSTDEFKAMVDRIRCVKQLESNSDTKESLPMLLRHKRRLIAMRDIEEGEVLSEGVNFGIYRSLKDDTRAEHPFRASKVQGMKAKRKIDQGDGIWFDDLM